MDGDARILRGGDGRVLGGQGDVGLGVLSQELSWKSEGFITGQMKSSRLTSFLPPY